MLTNLSKEKSFKKLIDNSKSSALFDLQMRKHQEQKTLLLFIPKNPAGITAGMTTFYSQPNLGNALASETIGKPRVSPLLSLNTSAVIWYLICVYASHFFAGRPYHFNQTLCTANKFNEGGIQIISLSNIRPIIIYFHFS